MLTNKNKKELYTLLIALALMITAQACGPTRSGGTQPYPLDAYPNAGAPSNVPHLALGEGKLAFDSHQAVFLDVRDAASYAQGHIPGALSIPADQVESRLKELDASQWIIAYCA